MSELENELNGPGGEGAAGGAPETEGGAGGGWSGPSQEEWKALQEQNQRLQDSLEGLTSVFAEAPTQRQPQKEEFDLSQLDMSDPYAVAWLADQIAQERMNSVAPYVRNAAQDQGSRQMQELLKTHETELAKDFPGGFDHKLAERAAFAFFDETGDAEGSVAAAAKYAAEVRQQERNAAIEEYKSKNSKGRAFTDFSAEGSAGVKASEPFKSYDDVLEKYASQTDL
jgi:hypothetical protein